MMAQSSGSSSKRMMCSLRSTEEARRMFDKYDKNGDCRICLEEVRDILISLGKTETVEEDARRILWAIDSDGDGYIDFDEFVEYFINKEEEEGKDDTEALRDAFKVYDLDGNGLISASELHAVLKKLGENCSLTDCQKMISSVDIDGDGNVDFEEFKNMMTSSFLLN